MAVQATQDQAIGGEALLGRLLSLARCQGEAELLILVGGRDELVGIDVHARGHAHQDVLGGAQVAGHAGQFGDLLERVDDDEFHARLDGGTEELLVLVIAVHRDALGREVGVQGDAQLTEARDIQAEALLSHPAAHGR